MAIITISRGTFSGGKSLAESVAENLEYQCISREVLRDAARDYGVPLDELSKALSDSPGRLDGRGRHLAKMHYLTYIQAELVKAIKDENVVYHGLAGHLLLQNVPHVLRVRVVAGMDFRIKAAMERTDLTRSDAIAFIKRIDARRDKWVKYLYHSERLDPSDYDLMINLDNITLDSACELVCLNASQPEFQPTDESRKRLSELVLSAEVKAMIAAQGHIRDDQIKVDVHDGVVVLGGKVMFIGDADKAREVARSVPGVAGIESRMRVGAVGSSVAPF